MVVGGGGSGGKEGRGEGKEEEVGGGECRGEGALLVGFRSEGADLKELRVRLQREEERAGGQGSKMLGREGVTGIDRVCNLGARKGETGRVRNFGFLHMVPESVCLRGRGEETERRDREGGRLNEQEQTVI